MVVILAAKVQQKLVIKEGFQEFLHNQGHNGARPHCALICWDVGLGDGDEVVVADVCG
jgi:hypothetical protein